MLAVISLLIYFLILVFKLFFNAFSCIFTMLLVILISDLQNGEERANAKDICILSST